MGTGLKIRKMSKFIRLSDIIKYYIEYLIKNMYFLIN
jgi:hypothetical protein